MEHEDDHPRARRKAERRVDGDEREVLLNEADRVLARAIMKEIEKHLGADFGDLRQRNVLMEKMLPTLQAITRSYENKAKFFDWWMSWLGKAVVIALTSGMFLALALGAAPAFRIMLHRAAGGE